MLTISHVCTSTHSWLNLVVVARRVMQHVDIAWCMDPDVEHKINSLLSSSNLGLAAKWSLIESYLLKCGAAYEIRIQPEYMLVHPQNRGGTGLNAFNAHALGSKIYALGADLYQLGKSTCFEIPQLLDQREHVMRFNERLVDDSMGMLACVTGGEKYLSVSSSHVAAFCRAALTSCATTQDTIKDKRTGAISMPTLQKDATLVSMLDKGWTWMVIRWQVEQKWPQLPALVQNALSALNNVVTCVAEIESLHTIAGMVDAQMKQNKSVDWKLCLEEASASRPHHVDYMHVLAEYVKLYSGGTDYPLIKFLAAVSQENNQSHRPIWFL